MTSEINLENYTTEDIKKAIQTVERYAAYRKKYYADNREKLIEKEKAYRKANPEAHNEKKEDNTIERKTTQHSKRRYVSRTPSTTNTAEND